MSIRDVHAHIDSMREPDLATLKRLVAQPSISSQNVGVRECAEMLKDIMTESGISTRVIETPGEPVVYGEVAADKPDAFTVIFYGHYDVQPAEPLEAWVSPPFEPVIRDGRLYGRGTGDNKGQLLAHILAVRSYLKTIGSLPINAKFVFEGEEECGSIYMPDFINANRDILTADMVYTSDGPLHESGMPAVVFGVRGILSVGLEIQTATQDNHSGNKGGVIPNAAWEMVDLLSTMKDANGRVTIEGFYDDVLAPTEHDMKLVEELPYDPKSLAEVFGVEKIDLNKTDFYRRLTLEPTLTINSIVSGYTPTGGKTIIPGSATAKLDMRLVDNQDPSDIFEKVRKHVERHSPKVKVKHMGHMLPSRTRSDLEACKVVVRAVETAYGTKPVVSPSMGGSLPDYIWTKTLGLPSVAVPYANADESNHAPNENLKLDCFYNGIHASAQVIHDLGNSRPKER